MKKEISGNAASSGIAIAKAFRLENPELTHKEGKWAGIAEKWREMRLHSYSSWIGIGRVLHECDIHLKSTFSNPSFMERTQSQRQLHTMRK